MIYRKQGAVARWENGTLIRVTESGVAVEEGDYFECRPERGAGFSPPVHGGGGLKPALRFPSSVVDSSRVLEVARALGNLPAERLIVTHGVAEHECDGRRWRDEMDRIHLALVHGRLRALVDSTTGRLDDIFTIGNALVRVEQTERAAPPHLRLAPNVTAALLPHLVGHVPANVRLLQTAGGVDGYGNDIIETEGEWPNFYRPSYRVRPVRMPLNLRLECDNADVDDAAPVAIALLAPVADLTLRVLVVDQRRVYPATTAVTRIHAVSNEREWYPYGGGSFGAALML